MTAVRTAPRISAASAALSLRPALAVLTATTAIGVPVALLWMALAPPEVARVVEGGVSEPLVGENEHRFDGLAIFVLLTLAAGVLAAVGLWMLRDLRGPVTLLTAVGGSMLAGAVAVSLGEWLADQRYDGSGEAGQLVDLAPEIASWWVLLAMPLGLSLTYATLTACTTAPSLGRRD